MMMNRLFLWSTSHRVVDYFDEILLVIFAVVSRLPMTTAAMQLNMRILSYYRNNFETCENIFPFALFNVQS